MKLRASFLKMASRKPWAKKLKTFLEDYEAKRDGSYEVEDEAWDDFLVDIKEKKSRDWETRLQK